MRPALAATKTRSKPSKANGSVRRALLKVQTPGPRGLRRQQGSAAHPASQGQQRARKPVGHLGNWSGLAAAVQRWRVADFDGLAAQLAAIEAAPGSPDVATCAAFVRARLLARTGKPKAAESAWKRAVALRDVHPGSHAFAEVEVLLANGATATALDRLAATGDTEFRRDARDLLAARLTAQVGTPGHARDAALSLYERSPLKQPRDELLARAARAVGATGDSNGARALWHQLVMQHPESDWVAEASRHVEPTSLSITDQFERLQRLFARRSYERAREVADVLWSRGHRRSEVGFLLGKIGSERLRDDYPGAERALVPAIADDSPVQMAALQSWALVLTKLARADEAIAAFDRWLLRFPQVDNDKRIELHYDRSRSLYLAGRPQQAADDLAAALAVNRKGIDAGKYEWFVAWWTLRSGNCARALELLAPLARNDNPLVGGKARYWTAHCLDRLDRRREAVTVLARLARTMPLTWYAALGENRLALWGESRHVPTLPDFSNVPTAGADPFAGLPPSADLRRLRLACAIGEPDTARAVLDSVRKALVRDLGAARVATLEAGLADPLETFSDAREAAMGQHGAVLDSLPTEATLAAWRAIYPRAFATHVVAASRRPGGPPEWMVYAHMLQESRYKPWLISGAPAYGLLELLDRTATRLAREAGDDYQLWMLMEPSWNVRWGAQYLGSLLRKFGGQLPFAIGSYNGGPMLFEWHLRVSERRQLSLDALVEDLGPHESRNYVRMVAGHMLRYLAIYASAGERAKWRARLVPQDWEAKWEKDPNY